MKRQATNARDLAAAAAATNAHLKGFAQYHTPPEWAAALAAGLPYHRHFLADLFAGSGSLLKGAANETTRELFALELDPDISRRSLQSGAGRRSHHLRGDFLDWLPLARDVDLTFDCLVLNPPWGLRWPTSALPELTRHSPPATRHSQTIDSTLATLRAANLLLSSGHGEAMLIGKLSTLRRLRRAHPADFRRVWLSLDLPSFFPGVSTRVGVLYLAAWFDRSRANGHRQAHPAEFLPLDYTTPQAAASAIRRLAAAPYRWDEIRESFQRNTDTPTLWAAVAEELKRRYGAISTGNHNLELDPATGRLRTWVTDYQRNSAHIGPDLAKALVSLNRTHPLELILQRATRQALRHAVDSGIWSVSPAAHAAIESALLAYSTDRAPIQPINSIQAIAWLDDQDEVTCTIDLGPFRAGHAYPLDSQTVAYKKHERRRRIRDGVRDMELVQVRGFDLCLTIGAGDDARKFYYNPERCDPKAYSLEHLAAHFAIPTVPDLATLHTEPLRGHHARLTELEALCS